MDEENVYRKAGDGLWERWKRWVLCGWVGMSPASA